MTKLFTNIFCGEAGSQHDSRVFQKSKLFAVISDIIKLEEYFLVGDSAYSVLNWLVPPFKDNGTLTSRHRKFNKKISSVRICVEHSIGLLKSRFRRLLHEFENTNIEFIVRSVCVACVIHNICILHDDLEIDIEDIEEDDAHEFGVQLDNEEIGERNKGYIYIGCSFNVTFFSNGKKI